MRKYLIDGGQIMPRLCWGPPPPNAIWAAPGVRLAPSVGGV